MKRIILIIGLLAVIGLCIVYSLMTRKPIETPRSQSVRALEGLQVALDRNNSIKLLSILGVPPAMQGKTNQEQGDFLAKALHDEVSPEGIIALSKIGTFGSLKDVFPEEADAWAKAVGVEVSDCVAFRGEKNGIRAEVVLCTNGAYRIIRVNNVKQMAL